MHVAKDTDLPKEVFNGRCRLSQWSFTCAKDVITWLDAGIEKIILTPSNGRDYSADLPAERIILDLGCMPDLNTLSISSENLLAGVVVDQSNNVNDAEQRVFWQKALEFMTCIIDSIIRANVIAIE